MNLPITSISTNPSMRLVIDANILVSELLRQRGRALIAHPALRIAIAENVWDEAEYELRRRLIIMARRSDSPEEAADALLASMFAVVTTHIAQIPAVVYDFHETVARSRIPRDPDDWHTVALALASDAAIWTADADFLGCGIATWTTDTLLAHLAYVEAE
jgi:predicted nucleic acid-binding protein